MNTDFTLLEKAAKQWDEAAKKFETAQGSYNSGVRPVGLGGTWNGAAASVALPTMAVTYDQFLAAPKEARAIASLLRDAHDQFVRLHSELTSVVAEAKKAGMAVSGDGLARYDFSDCTEQEKFSIQHDPDLKDTVAAWNQRISQAVKAVDDADQGAKLALKAAVEHPDKPGAANGFNAGAQGDIEKAEAKEATDLSKKLAKDGKLSAQDMEEMHRLFRDNQDQKAFSQTYLAGLGPEETAKINYKLSGLAHGDAKQDILAVQQGMAMSIASATKNPQDSFYASWRKGLKEMGDNRVNDSKTNPLYGYQSFVDLMTHGKGYGKQFYKDLGDDIIATEKDHPDIWTKWGAGHKDIATDPLDNMLDIMSKQPDAATDFFQRDADGKNERMQYLLKDRDWPKSATATAYGLHTMDLFENRIGLGNALEAAATGDLPGSKHALGGHTEAEARVMQDTITILNQGDKGDSPPANLRGSLGRMLQDYTPDTHEILGGTNPEYTQLHKGDIWKDDKGVHMDVSQEHLIRLMRGVADDPAAYSAMYQAERQYAADSLVRTPFANEDARNHAVKDTATIYGSYDAISSDVIFDKRDKGVQWARDVNHHVNSSIGAVLNFVPEKSIPAVDAGLRLVDFAMYDWTKEQIAEANAAANHDNRQNFTVGRGQVDNLVWQWGGQHGHGPDAGDYMMRELINDSHGAHQDGRNQAYVYLDRDK
ncbi:hypothetical protein [Streptomyces cucumeris]|uniref:hypothetical protein n=1 Tax=Streptomyces cucumeris TaxID=2962890 RepID=UPI0020C8E8EA|nr:hypothetical protein [Streptomyces sp. NEAU-Y11]MCP9209369.1 hypothetical protein [Streptomyces sp. NEAU-Y11]